MAPGISRWSAAKSSSVRTSIRAGTFGVPISRASLSGDIVVGDDMDAPSPKKRDAILGHVASWGDRRTPKTALQRNRRGLSMRLAGLGRPGHMELLFRRVLPAPRRGTAARDASVWMRLQR